MDGFVAHFFILIREVKEKHKSASFINITLNCFEYIKRKERVTSIQIYSNQISLRIFFINLLHEHLKPDVVH